MSIPAFLVAGFPPSRDLLLDLARRQVDDVMLKEIAGADFPGCEDDYLPELKKVRDKGVISPGLVEVQTELHMTSWNFAERPGVLSLRAQRCRHQIGLFSSAALLRAAADPDCTGRLGIDDTTLLGSCLEHAMALGKHEVEAAARFLTWRCTEIGDLPEWEPFPGQDAWSLLSAIALLIMTAHLRPLWANEIVFRDTAEWVLAEEQDVAQKARAANYNWDPRPEVLRNGSWQKFVAELTRAQATIRDGTIRSSLDLCGILLAEDRLGYVD
jgi:hypothetical protein